MILKINYKILLGDNSIYTDGFCIMESDSVENAKNNFDELFILNLYGDDDYEIVLIEEINYNNYGSNVPANSYGVLYNKSENEYFTIYFSKSRNDKNIKKLQDKSLNKKAKRVADFGIGKLTIRMKLHELPKDIQEEIIERFSKSNIDDERKITKDTKEIMICCDDIIKVEE